MRLIALLAMAAALAAGEAQAQPAPWQPERSTAGWTFTPSAAFGGYWDSNVTIRNEGSPVAEEWVGLLSPRGELDYNGRRTKFNAGYSGTVYAYRTLDELTRFDQRARLSARRQMTQRLSLNTTHSATATPTTDDLDVNGLPYLRVGSKVYTGRAGSAYALSDRMGMTAEYSFQWVDFDEDADVAETRLRGGYANAAGVALTRRLDERLSVGGSYQYVYSRLTTRDLSARVQRATADTGWQFARSTSASVSAGVSHVYVPETGRDVTGPAFSGSIGHQAGRVSLSAGYEHAYVASFAYGSAQEHRAVHGSASVPLMRGRMVLSGGVGYRESEPVFGTNVIALESMSANLNLGINTTRWLRTEIFYTGTFQDSSARGEYNRTRVGVQFVTFKPVRIQ